MAASAELSARLAAVRQTIGDACATAGRPESDITLIVVTKFHPAQLVRDLSGLGVTDVGENRHQEAAEKSAQLRDLDLTWHFIGQLQSNKARAVLEYADVIHSVDRSSLVSALNKAWLERAEASGQEKTIPSFIQINLTDDPGRGGVNPRDLDAFANAMSEHECFDIRGVMAVAPLEEDPAAAFERVARASSQLQTVVPGARFISAGMSHDYPQAIAHGATHLRIGSAITGNRPAGG